MPNRFNIVLYEPVIPQNTGSIARLCACTGAALHLIRPLGFQIDDASVRRAGLDYWEHVGVTAYDGWEAFLATEKPSNLFFFSKFATQSFTEIQFKSPVYLVFGSETKGLPTAIHDRYPDHMLLIPMRTHLVRSLNLAQAAAIVLYEALRQNTFAGIKKGDGGRLTTP